MWPDEEVRVNDNGLTADEEAAIEIVLRDKIGALVAGCESLDMDVAFQSFSRSPAFLRMTTDGSLSDCESYISDNVEYMSNCSRFRLHTRDLQVRVLGPAAAVVAWSYSAEASFRSGEQALVEKAGATFVFGLVRGEWQIVYYHESSTPPVRTTTE